MSKKQGNWITNLFCKNQSDLKSSIDSIPESEKAHLYKAAITNAFLKDNLGIDYSPWYNFKPEKWIYIPNKFIVTNEMEQQCILCNSTEDILADTFTGDYGPQILGVDGTGLDSHLYTLRFLLYKDIAYAILADKHSPQAFKDAILLNSYKNNKKDSDALFLYTKGTLLRTMELLEGVSK